MRKIKCYCDICGREVNANDLIVFKARDFYSVFVRKIGFEKWEICKDCLREIGKKQETNKINIWR